MLLTTALLTLPAAVQPVLAQAVTTGNLGLPPAPAPASTPVSSAPVLGLPAVRPRPLAVGGVAAAPTVSTAPLRGGLEGVPLGFLPRLGVAVSSAADRLSLTYRGRSLVYQFPATAGQTAPQPGAPGRWTGAGFAADSLPDRLPLPQQLNGGLLVPLPLLTLLGVPVSVDSPEILDFAPFRPGLPSLAGTPAGEQAAGGQAAAPSRAVTQLPTTQLPTTPLPTTQFPASPVPVPSVPVSPAAAPSPVQLPAPQLPTPQLPAVQAPPAPAVPTFTPTGTLATLRSSRTLDRNIELQRVVLEFAAPPVAGVAAGPAASLAASATATVGAAGALTALPYTVSRDRSGLSVALPGVTSTPLSQRLPGGDTLSVNQGNLGSAVRLNTGGGRSEIFTLQNPYRIVIDTTTNIDSSVPPPVEDAALPDGVTLRRLGGLTLLTFDPARYQPRVITAPLGSATPVAELVRQAGGVAGVNGGYFDPSSSLPVDLVARGGLMISASLEKRATVGFDAQGTPTLGYPRPRYLVSGSGVSGPFTLQVNSVGARDNPQWVTAFVGDGRTAVGDGALTTLVLQGGPDAPGRVARAVSGRTVPGRGEFALTFDPVRYPQLAQPQGAALSYTLNWQLRGWEDTVEALSAGPLLVSGGQVVLDGLREGFDVGGSIWRATRQVAFIQLGSQYGVAYLSSGTPGDFARALALAGVRNALRFDSGSSATVFVAGGYLDAGGYLNTVWSRPVPNALVFVPRGMAGR